MKRVLHTLSACCLLMAVLIGGCGALSLRDHRVLIHRRFDGKNDMRVNAIASCNGGLWLFSKVYFRKPGTTFVDPGWYFGPGSYGMDDKPWGVPHHFKEDHRGAYGHTLVLPHWFVSLSFIALGSP